MEGTETVSRAFIQDADTIKQFHLYNGGVKRRKSTCWRVLSLLCPFAEFVRDALWRLA